MPATIQETPASLVERGLIHCGFFKDPFRRVNLLEAKNLGGSLARPFRWLRLKEWVGFGINHPKLFGGIIIQDAKYAASGTVYLYNRETKEQFDWLILDLPLRVKLPETLWASECRCGRGSNRMIFEHDLENYRHRIHLEHKATKSMPSLSADLLLHQDWREVDPLVVSLPIKPDHHTYTHKSPLHLEGTISIGDNVFDFEPKRDLGNLDEQKTFYPYRSDWKWGCFITQTDKGHEVMLNFVDQMTPENEPGEDAIWIDGKLTLLEQPDISPLEMDGGYRIEDEQGRMKLRFTPEGSKKEKRNFWLIAMDYEQFFGYYDGEVVDNSGNVHHIHRAFGALERMAARF